MPAHLSLPAVPELRDGDLLLRGHRQDDLPGIVELAQDERSQRWTTNIPTPYGEEDARAFLIKVRRANFSGDQRFWAIEVDGVFAGTVNYTHHGHGQAELGYALRPGARGAGVATRAVRLAVEFAFERDGLDVLIWRAAHGNLASRRVAWANGFSVDGVWPDAHVNSAGTHLDDLVVGHLRRPDPRVPAHPWWVPTVLEGDGLRLRPWRDDDQIPEGPDETSERFSEGMQPTPEGYAEWLLARRSRMAAGEGVFWCVADAATDSPLGHVQILRLDVDFIRGTGLLGYWAYPDARGQGVIGRALELLIPHAYAPRTDDGGRDGLGLHRLQAGTDLANTASQRVLRRAGFRQCAEERAVLAQAGGGCSDALTFELLATDDRGAQRVLPTPTTELTTARLRLRPWRETDRQIAGPDSVARRNMSGAAMPSPDTWDDWLARRERLRDTGTLDFCVADRSTDEALGSVAVFGIDREVGHGEVGYWLHPAARGHGYLDEALEALVRLAFTPRDEGGAGLDRLHAATVLDNFSSRAVLLRAGFRRWGADHQSYVTADGERTDGAYYELMRTWRAQPSPALEVPRIDGDRVRLRPWRMRDAERVLEAATDATTRHWLPQLPRHYNLDVARDYVHSAREHAAAGTAVVWCVADLDTDEALGSLEFAALQGPRPDTASIGYWAHPAARGRGVLTEGVGLAIEHAFAPRAEGGLDRRRLVLIAADGNDASQALARRHGFRPSGTERRAEILGDGSVVDMLRFELLRDPPERSEPAHAVPTLEGERVRLRPWRLADAPRVLEACTDPVSRHWLAGLPDPYLDETARAYIRRQWADADDGTSVGWCVADRETDECLGALSVMDLRGDDSSAGEIGYWAHPEARGRGVMTEAVGLAVTYALAADGLARRRLTLNVADGNGASAAIARRHGFVHVGTDRRAEPLGDGTYVDLLRFDRLRD